MSSLGLGNEAVQKNARREERLRQVDMKARLERLFSNPEFREFWCFVVYDVAKWDTLGQFPAIKEGTCKRSLEDFWNGKRSVAEDLRQLADTYVPELWDVAEDERRARTRALRIKKAEAFRFAQEQEAENDG